MFTYFFQVYLQLDSVTLKVSFSYVYVFEELNIRR